MLKKLVPLAVILLLGAMPAAAEPVCGNGGELEWLFAGTSSPAMTSDAPATLDLAGDTDRRGGGVVRAFCQANCESGTVSCNGSVCSAYNRNCPNEQGHVTCDGVTTWCPTTCPPSGCTPFQCRQPCKVPGCVSVCVDLEACECETQCY